jgi:hypothetical protein
MRLLSLACCLLFFLGSECPGLNAQTVPLELVAPLAAAGLPQPGQLQDSQPPVDKQKNIPDVLRLPKTLSAPPFTVADKFDYRVVQTFGLRGLLGAAVSSSFGQGTTTPYEWGGGMEGYGKRFGSAFLGNLSRQSFNFVLESALKEDPRYFPAEDETKKQRLLNAMKQVVVCKTDAGHSSFAYGRVASAFAAGQFVNTWQPNSNDAVTDGLERGVFSLAGDLAYNLMQEFFPFTRPRSLRHRH